MSMPFQHVGRVPPRGAAPTGRKKSVGRLPLTGVPPNAAAPDHDSQNTSSPEGAKDLPNGWRWTTLRDIAAIAGGVTKGQKRRPHERVRQVPYLRVANVQRGYIDLNEMKEIEASESEIDALRLQPGDVLFNEGGDRDKLGRGWVWNGELPECIHQNHVFRARLRDPRNSPKFISYYGNSAGQKYFYDKGKHTTNLASINLTKLGALPIPLPSPDVQRRIVAEIDKQFTRLEAGVAALRRVQANLKRYRAAVLKAACEGDWQRKPLGELLQDGRSMGYGVLKPGPHVPDGVRLLKSGQVRDGTLDLTEDYRISTELDAEFKRTRMQGGELLLNLVGASIGRSAIATPELKGANVSRAIAVIPVVPERTKWVQIVLSSPDSQSGILGRRTGIAQPVLNLGQVKQLPIPLPPLAEQTRIVAEVERRLSVVEELESVVSANLQRATRLRQSILQKAFTGELSVEVESP